MAKKNNVTAETAPAEAQVPQEAPEAAETPREALKGQGVSQDPEAAETAPEATGESEAGPEPVLAVVDTARGLNLRRGPGRDHEILTVLPDNSFVEVLELMGRYPDGCLYATEVPGWALVCPYQLPGTPAEDRGGVFDGAGWVDRRFLAPVRAGQTT